MATRRSLRYQVYSHSIDGEVFYVGKGMDSRPLSGESRNATWQRIVASNAGRFEVQILSRHTSDQAASAEEHALIRRLRPSANLSLNSNKPCKPSLRQLNWQRKKRRAGLCDTCGRRKIRPPSKRKCRTCLAADRERKARQSLIPKPGN